MCQRRHRPQDRVASANTDCLRRTIGHRPYQVVSPLNDTYLVLDRGTAGRAWRPLPPHGAS
eukprot:3265264-Prymnesium_polylepis.1